MKIEWARPAFLLLALVFSSVVAGAQTSVAGSVYGAFNGATSGNGTQQSPANQAGGMIEIRHISNVILGFEATYAFNRSDETYSKEIYPPTNSGCAGSCAPQTQTLRVPANAHEITFDWTPSLHVGNLRPFGVLGVGLLLNVPSGHPTLTLTGAGGSAIGDVTAGNTSTSTKAVYVYGAGLDWGLLPHFGIRIQYRGNLYSAPNLSSLYSSTDSFTHTAEPMAGVYFNF